MISKKLFSTFVRGYQNLNRRQILGSVLELHGGFPVGQGPGPGAGAWPGYGPGVGGKDGEQPDKKKAMEPEEIDGFDIPEFKHSMIKLGKTKGEEERLGTIIYPLVPTRPRKGEPVFAYAKITWDEKLHKYVYNLVEPKLSPNLEEILKKVKELLEQRLNMDFSKLKRFEAVEYLTKQLNELISYFDFRIDETEKKVLKYYLERDFMGLGKIEAVMRDPEIEDISCDGVEVPLFIFHRNPKLGSTLTNLTYETPEELDSFVTRLSQLCGKSISVAEPLVDGALPDGSRLQATLATDIARRGSNFTIRKFTETPLTPVHLLTHGTVDIKTIAYLWFVSDMGSSILVCGGTASGKTTFLNMLSLFLRPDKKIVSIEDTAELQLPHPHWIPTVARTPVSEGKKERGDIDLFDLLRESLRQRPDYIIVGEVRGPEAFILFQQMATGHPSLATIHAENMPKLIDRLTTPPISLPPGLIASLDLVVFLSRLKYKDNYVRRLTEVVEVLEYDQHEKEPRINKVFAWDSINDKYKSNGKSALLKRIAAKTGIAEDEIKGELERRMLVLQWMQENEIMDYRDVNKIINMYYNYPQRTIAMIMERM
jgi:archaeal flagellar protein FlaI